MKQRNNSLSTNPQGHRWFEGGSSCIDSVIYETTKSQGLCIYQLIATQAQRNPDAIAIVAPGRTSLTYRHLLSQVDNVGQTLDATGVGRNDRIAIVLPNGPEAAVTFLAVAARATSAPLNPAYRANEYDFYLSDLHPKALLVHSGSDSL